MNTLLWILLGLIALWMALRFLPAGADWHRPLVELIALIDLLTAPLLAILIWTVFAHAWPQCLLALIELTLASCQRLCYRLPPADRTSQSSSDHGLSVMTLNCRFGQSNPEEVVRCVRAYGIEVLALQEVEGKLLQSFQAAGLDRLRPYRHRELRALTTMAARTLYSQPRNPSTPRHRLWTFRRLQYL